MEIVMSKLSFPAHKAEAITVHQQGVLSWWLEHILAARLNLNLPSSEADALDNLINAFLGRVLMLGLKPPLEVVKRVEQGSIAVSGFLLDPMTPRVRRYRCDQHGSIALLAHGFRALAGADEYGYRRIAGIGYDCFVFAANTFRPTEYDAIVYNDLAVNFERYSAILNQAIIHASQPDRE